MQSLFFLFVCSGGFHDVRVLYSSVSVLSAKIKRLCLLSDLMHADPWRIPTAVYILLLQFNLLLCTLCTFLQYRNKCMQTLPIVKHKITSFASCAQHKQYRNCKAHDKSLSLFRLKTEEKNIHKCNILVLVSIEKHSSDSLRLHN